MYFRKHAIELACEMLKSKPEQEVRLLGMIVDKIGDTDGKVNSKACDVLKQLLQTHPVMKLVVVREIRNFIYRPNNKLSGVFRAVNFLGQISCGGRHEVKVALQLAECYLSIFEKALDAKEEGSRLLAVLLHGLNKVFPLLDDVAPLFKNLDAIFRLIHSATSWNTSTQALVLVSNFALSSKIVDASALDSKTQLMNRYYRALYSKLLSDQVKYSVISIQP
jgi:ribosome biogenesis protein MAK21